MSHPGTDSCIIYTRIFSTINQEQFMYPGCHMPNLHYYQLHAQLLKLDTTQHALQYIYRKNDLSLIDAKVNVIDQPPHTSKSTERLLHRMENT